MAETKEGFLDLKDLEEHLIRHHNSGRQMIGCFSAASSITGIIADDIACTLLLHQYGALSFWDYNVAAPYVSVDMNPFVHGIEENSVNKDAIYFSGHKFAGGVQTCGILVAKKALFKHTKACVADGFFTPQDHKKVSCNRSQIVHGLFVMFRAANNGIIVNIYIIGNIDIFCMSIFDIIFLKLTDVFVF